MDLGPYTDGFQALLRIAPDAGRPAALLFSTAGMLGLTPTIGDQLIMPSFVAVIVGGLGSLVGTLFGGLLIGIAAGVVTVFYPSASEATIYVMMALVLLVRPHGLFGEEGGTKL